MASFQPREICSYVNLRLQSPLARASMPGGLWAGPGFLLTRPSQEGRVENVAGAPLSMVTLPRVTARPCPPTWPGVSAEHA